MTAATDGWRGAARDSFTTALAGFGEGPALVVAHNDADGLASAAILARTLGRAGRPFEVRIAGRGEQPWADPLRAELRARPVPGGLVILDLGVRVGPILPGVPALVVDHHVPEGEPGDGAVVVSGHGVEPEAPTTSLLAFAGAAALADVDDLLWLAALGAVGDLGERAPFPELAAAKKRHGAAALKAATALVNAPRRSSSGDTGPALALLLKADGPQAVLSGEHSETAALREAQAEVRAALDAAKRAPPTVRGPVALIRLSSPCQIHPLVAQAWRGRLKDRIVIAANDGYRPGWVHFAARTATGRDLVAFFKERAPVGAGDAYGSGHAQASGGALRPAAWAELLAGLGFGLDAKAPA